MNIFPESREFHLAIEGGDLSKTLPFYKSVLGLEFGASEEGNWQDVNFWGNEVTIHASTPRTGPVHSNLPVAGMTSPTPHFGVHLSRVEYLKIIQSLRINFVPFLQEPITRFPGAVGEQSTFFVMDPNYNVLELKTYEK